MGQKIMGPGGDGDSIYGDGVGNGDGAVSHPRVNLSSVYGEGKQKRTHKPTRFIVVVNMDTGGTSV